MVRKQATVVLVLAAFVASTFVGTAQAAGFLNARPASGGLLARLNKPIVPGMPTLPGMPTASPLGLIAPRLSNAVLIFQKGGLKTPAGRLSGLGVVSPRISPVAALITTPPKTRQAQMLYGLTILSPRAAVLVAMLKGARGLAAGVR
jgi:hypothetical protein